MAEMMITVNGETYTVDVDSETPLLWVLRDTLGLTGTKYSCGSGICGSCTVLIGGEPVRSCVTPVASLGDHEVTTIEGLSEDGSHPLQVAWIAEQVAQCGYCQPGQILMAAALLAKKPHPTDAEIEEWMSGNLCRCGTYQRIRRAIRSVSQEGGVG